MQELLPLAAGLLLGGALGFLSPVRRLPVGIPCVVMIGLLATVVTGEFRVSWAYLLIDIPLVASATALGVLGGRFLRPILART